MPELLGVIVAYDAIVLELRIKTGNRERWLKPCGEAPPNAGP
jgi:hypothetical protein